MTTVNPCRFCRELPAMTIPDHVTHSCYGMTVAFPMRIGHWNRDNPAPKAQGETMDKPWIDGSVTPPSVGSVIRVRSKELADEDMDSVMEWKSHHINPHKMHYYVLEKSPREYVPPVAPLPELEPTRDYGPTDETLNGSGNWCITVQSLRGCLIKVEHIDRSTARRMFNAAVKAMRGEG